MVCFVRRALVRIVAAQTPRCLIIANHAESWGGGLSVTREGSDVLVENSILWGNTRSHTGTPDQIDGPCTVTYSDVEGGWEGLGNIDADPWFRNWGEGDFHLLLGSPCLDAGDPSFVPWSRRDIDGDHRLIGPRIDMGADEAKIGAPNPGGAVRKGR